MEALIGLTTGVAGIVVIGLVAAFAIGWLVLRLNARKLKRTT